jgi:hypothetical protein
MFMAINLKHLSGIRSSRETPGRVCGSGYIYKTRIKGFGLMPLGLVQVDI